MFLVKVQGRRKQPEMGQEEEVVSRRNLAQGNAAGVERKMNPSGDGQVNSENGEEEEGEEGEEEDEEDEEEGEE